MRQVPYQLDRHNTGCAMSFRYTQHRNRLDQNLSNIMKIYFIPFYLKGNPKYCTKIFGVKFCLQKLKNNIFAENFL